MTTLNKTHDPSLLSWVASAQSPDTDFPIQNLPLSVFRRRGTDEALNMSPTKLRRRLEAEFTSYWRDGPPPVLDGMYVGEIGALVGFQEASAFRRAFKAWSGVQPGEYRRRASTGPAASQRGG